MGVPSLREQRSTEVMKERPWTNGDGEREGLDKVEQQLADEDGEMEKGARK